MTAIAAIATRGGHLPESPFLRQLVQVIRADDSFGSWDGLSDTDLLADFVVTKEERRQIPIIGEPDPEVIWRMEQFYAAIGLVVGRRTDCMASPMSRITWEGFGRVVLLAGQLVVLSRHVRDVHRFGFESFAALAAEGERLAQEATAMIELHPEVARGG
ncbi:MAG: NifX-associated nitrogen fixation protein [Pseudomonadota bacterium]